MGVSNRRFPKGDRRLRLFSLPFGRSRRSEIPCKKAHFRKEAPSLKQISLNHLQGIERPIPMAAFIPMRRIHARANQPVANVIPRPQGRFHIRPVVRIHIHRIVRPFALGGGNQLPHDIIAVRPAGVLRADGHLPFGALHALADAAHVHRNRLRHTIRHRRRAAMPNFLIDRDVDVHAALRRQILVLQILRERLQDADRQLVIQEAALDVPAFGDAAARVKADEIAHVDAELANILRRAALYCPHPSLRSL